MLGGLNNKIIGGNKIESKTLSLRTVESEISVPLEKVQNKYKNLDIGSYPFFKQGKINKDQLGVIELKQDCAFVAVPKSIADALIVKLNNAKLKKKKVRVTLV